MKVLHIFRIRISLSMRYRVSHSYKTVDRIIAVYLFIYLFIYRCLFMYFLLLEGNILFIYLFIYLS
jgi:hypothetical protein